MPTHQASRPQLTPTIALAAVHRLDGGPDLGGREGLLASTDHGRRDGGAWKAGTQG